MDQQTTSARTRKSILGTAVALSTAMTLGAGITLKVPVAYAARQEETVQSTDTRFDLTMNGQATVSRQDETQVCPGVHLTEFERLEPRGWQQGAILDIDLTDPNVSLDYLYDGTVASTGMVREMADQAENIAGAINGDFFDINNSGAPTGIAVDETDGVLKTPD